MAFRKVSSAIIVFVKLPVEGKVKTRLAKDMGNNFAAAFYKVCAEHTFDELSKLKNSVADIFLFCFEESELEQMKKWTRDNFSYYVQEGNDLGERMYNALKLIFKKNYQEVVIIGTDVPDINCKAVEKDLLQLKTEDCVIGPANDGGYYLLGFKSKVIDLFSGINWNRDSVFDKTVEKLKELNVTYKVSDELIDIDTKEDMENWSVHFTGGKNHPVKLFIDSKEKFFI